MKSVIVLISGRQGSGKSSLARGISDAIFRGGLQIGVDELAFAKPIYDLQDTIMEFMVQNGVPADLIPKKDGDLLQNIGEWARKRFGEDVWVNMVKTKIARLSERAPLGIPFNRWVYIISDTRYPNEVEAFPAQDVLKVRLECPEEIRKERILRTPGQFWRENTKHSSEVSLDDYRHWNCILNTDSISPEDCVDQVIQQLKGRFYA